MKMLLVILVAANAVAFYTFLNAPRSGTAPAKMTTASANVTTLVLLSEVDPQQLHRRGEQVGATQTTGQCFALGPLTKQGDEQAVEGWTQALDAKVSMAIAERLHQTRYWIYLEPVKSLKAALVRVAMLQSKKIDDIHVIRRGDMKFAISLGLFSREATRRRRVEELKEHGVDPRVSKRLGGEKLRWLVAKLSVSTVFPEEQFAAQFPQLSAVAETCPDQVAKK